jgi:hypothetical protein
MTNQDQDDGNGFLLFGCDMEQRLIVIVIVMWFLEGWWHKIWLETSLAHRHGWVNEATQWVLLPHQPRLRWWWWFPSVWLWHGARIGCHHDAIWRFVAQQITRDLSSALTPQLTMTASKQPVLLFLQVSTSENVQPGESLCDVEALLWLLALAHVHGQFSHLLINNSDNGSFWLVVVMIKHSWTVVDLTRSEAKLASYPKRTKDGSFMAVSKVLHLRPAHLARKEFLICVHDCCDTHDVAFHLKHFTLHVFATCYEESRCDMQMHNIHFYVRGGFDNAAMWTLQQDAVAVCFGWSSPPTSNHIVSFGKKIPGNQTENWIVCVAGTKCSVKKENNATTATTTSPSWLLLISPKQSALKSLWRWPQWKVSL